MIIGIGIDSVEIDRFKDWHSYSDKQLSKIFSAEEIVYCRSNSLKSAERFAARFAAREAVFKALSCCNSTIPFLRLCKAIQIKKNYTGKPELIVNWHILDIAEANYTMWLSLTHTKAIATAMIIIEKKSR